MNSSGFIRSRTFVPSTSFRGRRRLPVRPLRRLPVRTRPLRRVPRSLVSRPIPLMSRPVLPARRVVRNRLRNLSRRLNNNAVQTTGRSRALVPPNRISPDGLAFLKCAFAPPDFNNTQATGIPDNFRGNTLLKKHRYTASLPFITNGYDYYILLLPTPGIAYWYAQWPTGTAPDATIGFVAVPFSDFTSVFGTNDTTTSDIVNSFRFISNHIELISTTNETQWTGDISSWKMPVKLITRTVPFTDVSGQTDLWTVTGLQGILSNSTLIYSSSSHAGVFSGCYNTAPDFPFSPILEQIPFAAIPLATQTGDFGRLTAPIAITGIDNNFDSLVIKMTNLTSTNSFILKCWAVVEYTVVPNSFLIDYTRLSPPCDSVALRLYREIIISLPLAISSKENVDFWSRVLEILSALGYGNSFRTTTRAIRGSPVLF